MNKSYGYWKELRYLLELPVSDPSDIRFYDLPFYTRGVRGEQAYILEDRKWKKIRKVTDEMRTSARHILYLRMKTRYPQIHLSIYRRACWTVGCL